MKSCRFIFLVFSMMNVEYLLINYIHMYKLLLLNFLQPVAFKISHFCSFFNLAPNFSIFLVCSSIKRKKQEELEREAQLEDLRRRREEKLSKLRSKGIGIKTNQRNSNEGPRPEVRVKGSDVIRSTGNEKYHRHSPDDLDDDLEMEELRSTTNKKNFVIGKILLKVELVSLAVAKIHYAETLLLYSEFILRKNREKVSQRFTLKEVTLNSITFFVL